jgi:hypothetical protein
MQPLDLKGLLSALGSDSDVHDLAFEISGGIRDGKPVLDIANGDSLDNQFGPGSADRLMEIIAYLIEEGLWIEMGPEQLIGEALKRFASEKAINIMPGSMSLTPVADANGLSLIEEELETIRLVRSTLCPPNTPDELRATIDGLRDVADVLQAACDRWEQSL